MHVSFSVDVAQRRQSATRGSCILLTLEVERITQTVDHRSKTQEAVMKKILLGTTIFAGLMAAGAAQAADMPLKAQRGPIYSDWTGFYIGIHGGYGWSDVDVNDDLRPFSEPNPKGWIFGGQAGYLRQWGTVVGGLEIDYSAAGLKETQTIKTETLTGKIDSLFSARARLGWL